MYFYRFSAQIPRRNGRKRLEKVNNDNGEMTSSPNKSSQGKLEVQNLLVKMLIFRKKTFR